MTGLRLAMTGLRLAMTGLRLVMTGLRLVMTVWVGKRSLLRTGDRII